MQALPRMNNVQEPSPDNFKGVYKNARFTWALTSLIGVPLRVETASNVSISWSKIWSDFDSHP